MGSGEGIEEDARPGSSQLNRRGMREGHLHGWHSNVVRSIGAPQQAQDDGVLVDAESGSDLSGEETVVEEKSEGGTRNGAAPRRGAGAGRGRNAGAASAPHDESSRGGWWVGRVVEEERGASSRLREEFPPVHPMGSPEGAQAAPHRNPLHQADGPPPPAETPPPHQPLPSNSKDAMDRTSSPPRSATLLFC